jgi:hypothetical protein
MFSISLWFMLNGPFARWENVPWQLILIMPIDDNQRMQDSRAIWPFVIELAPIGDRL